MYLSPRLLVPPNRSLPPLQFCRGVILIQAANSRPDLNKDGSATVAAMALAPASLERLKADDKARAQDLQRDGKWIHLWRVVGTLRQRQRLRSGGPR